MCSRYSTGDTRFAVYILGVEAKIYIDNRIEWTVVQDDVGLVELHLAADIFIDKKSGATVDDRFRQGAVGIFVKICLADPDIRQEGNGVLQLYIVVAQVAIIVAEIPVDIDIVGRVPGLVARGTADIVIPVIGTDSYSEQVSAGYDGKQRGC